jgi:hypothetical protein
VANADGTGAHQVSPVVLVELQSNVDWRQDRFHASPLGEQIQASAYIVNRDGSLRLLYPNLGEPLKSRGDPHLSPVRVPQPSKPQSTIAIPGR